MRYEVHCSVELNIDADSEQEARNKALRYVGNDGPTFPPGIMQATLWDLRITELDDTEPELEDEQKWERR